MERRPPPAAPPTDFQSLRHGTMDKVRVIQHRTPTDWLVDILTPVMIFVMTYSLVFFLLDVRYVYLELTHSNNPEVAGMYDLSLKWVAFCFVMGVVSLNRLIARDGRDESIIYIFGLVLVVGLYTFTTTGQMGSMASNFMNEPYLATAFNMGIVAFIWWAVNRITHECCVDENVVAGDIGLLTGTARRLQGFFRSASKPEPVVRPKRRDEPMIMMNDLAPVDPSEWKPPSANVPKPLPPGAATARLPKRHPGISIFYASIPAMIVFALGQRVLLRGDAAVVQRAHWFLFAYTVSALSLLMLSSLGGLREYFRARRITIPGGLGLFWVGLGALMIGMVVFGSTWMPLPHLPVPAGIAQIHGGTSSSDGKEDSDLASAGTDDDKQGSGSNQGNDQNAQPSDNADKGERNSDSSKKEGRSSSRTSKMKNMAPPRVPPIDFAANSEVMKWLGRIVMVGLGIFGFFALLRLLGMLASAFSRGRAPGSGFFRRFFAALDRLLQRMTQLPSLPRRRTPRRVSPQVALSSGFHNPLNDSRMSPTEVIKYSYAALCALATDLATPRRPDQTPYEFIETFPDSMKTLREDAVDLTGLYVLAAYSNIDLTPQTLDTVRKFWRGYETVRRRVVR